MHDENELQLLVSSDEAQATQYRLDTRCLRMLDCDQVLARKGHSRFCMIHELHHILYTRLCSQCALVGQACSMLGQLVLASLTMPRDMNQVEDICMPLNKHGCTIPHTLNHQLPQQGHAAVQYTKNLLRLTSELMS